MSTTEPIVCKPTKWFLWRAVAMLLMFLVLGAFFLKDWRVGYPKKNVVFYTFQAFEAAKEEFGKREKAGQSASAWETFATAQRIPYPEEEGILPTGMSRDQPWPDVLLDYESYQQSHRTQGNKTVPPLWTEFSNEQRWAERPKTGYDAAKIRNQLVYGIVCLVLAAGAAFLFFRNMAREMKVDGEAYYAPGGVRIPFGSIQRIDKRKWESKGLATLIYRADTGEERKAKVDGMVYGQFQEENGAPAQALFDHLIANFSGELVELEDPDSADSSEGEPGDAEG